MIDVHDLDFSRCIVNPFNTENVKVIRGKYPELRFNDISLSEEDRDMKYIVLMYDINSPISGMFSDYNEKKVQAAILAGYDIDEDGRFFREIEDALIGKNDGFNAMIVRYIIIHGSPDLLAYNSNNEILATEMIRSLQAGRFDSKELKDIRNNIKSITEDQAILYEKIFKGEETQALKNKLYETVEQDNLSIRPEDIAKKLAKQIFNPKIDPFKVGELEYDE